MNYDFNGKRHRFVYGNRVEESALSKQVRLLVGTSYFKSLKCDLPRTNAGIIAPFFLFLLLQKKEARYRSENCLLTQRSAQKNKPFEVRIFCKTQFLPTGTIGLEGCR